MDAHSENIKKLIRYVHMNVNDSNLWQFCHEYGISILPNTDMRSFFPQFQSFLSAIDPDNLKNLMRKIGLPHMDNNALWDIFIIHSSKNKKEAIVISEALMRIGVPYNRIYCSSTHDFGTNIGESFHTVIYEVINSVKISIVLLSDDSVRSAYCLQEMGAVLSHQIAIVPILIDEYKLEDMPGFLDNTHYQALSFNNFDDYKKLLFHISKILNIDTSELKILESIKLMSTKLHAMGD